MASLERSIFFRMLEAIVLKVKHEGSKTLFSNQQVWGDDTVRDREFAINLYE